MIVVVLLRQSGIEVEELSPKLTFTIRAAGSHLMPTLGRIEFTRANVLEPKYYRGARDAKDVENFLFDME